jgi:hypothetical protein
VKSQIINLLPTEKVRLLNIERINAFTTLAAVVVGATMLLAIGGMLLIIGGLAAGRAALASEVEKSTKQIETLNKTSEPGVNLEERSRLLQAQLGTIKVILDAKEQVQFARALERLGQIVPPDVSWSQAGINENQIVTIIGKARTFAAVGRFAEALKKDGTSINSPESGSTTYFHDVTVSSVTYSDSEGAANYALTFRLGEETFHAAD